MSNKINPNDPAFPFVEPNAECNVCTGLSIRAELAARAMEAMIGTLTSTNSRFAGCDESDIAREALQYADALLNELNKEV